MSLGLITVVSACLEDRRDIPHGERVVAVAAGDVNADGHPDLVVAADFGGELQATVSTRLGDGTGTFGDPIQSPLASPYPPVALALTDIDGDGNIDVVAVDEMLFSVQVFLGKGDGTWDALGSVSTCEEPKAVAAADLDADGYADVAVACRDDGGHYLDVFRGSASGQLVDRESFIDVAGTVAFGVAIGDLNGDGHADIITSGLKGGSALRVHFNDGTGTFEPGDFFSGGLQGVALAHLNGDPHLDVAAIDGDEVRLFQGSAEGVLVPLKTLSLGGRGFAIAVGDVGSGRREELVVSRPDDDNVSVFFRGPTKGKWLRKDFATGPAPHGVALADFEGTGTVDVVTANRASPGSLTVWSGR